MEKFMYYLFVIFLLLPFACVFYLSTIELKLFQPFYKTIELIYYSIKSLKRPLNGNKIEILWLKKNNGAPSKNAYIGSVGRVKNSQKDFFVLAMETANLVINNYCVYKKIKPKKYAKS